MNIKNNQSGVASMVVVILIMTILTLIVLSMTQNANREQRQALDRQLNSQAFYAAESGVSDLKDYIAQNPAATDTEKTDCDPLSLNSDEYFPGKSSRVSDASDTDGIIRYSCVLYDLRPETLKYSAIGTSNPITIPIEDDDGETFKELTFSWTKKDGGTDFGGCPSSGPGLPSKLEANNCDAGMLRISLINPVSNNRKELSDNTYQGYFKPTNGGGSGNASYSNGVGTPEKQGTLVNAACGAGKCSVTLKNINKSKLYLNMRSIYKINDVEISGKTTTGNVKFLNAQAEVDSTGRANDILKRIRVRIELSELGGGALPGFVLQSNQDICKQLKVFPPNKVVERPC